MHRSYTSFIINIGALYLIIVKSSIGNSAFVAILLNVIKVYFVHTVNTENTVNTKAGLRSVCIAQTVILVKLSIKFVFLETPVHFSPNIIVCLNYFKQV